VTSSYIYQEGDLWTVLSHYGWTLPASKRSWQTIKCGLHPDNKPSCRVNDKTGGFACMSCGLKGDVVGVVKAVEGVEWSEAYRRCTELVGGNDRKVRGGTQSGGRLSGSSRTHRGGGTFVPSRLRER